MAKLGKEDEANKRNECFLVCLSWIYVESGRLKNLVIRELEQFLHIVYTLLYCLHVSEECGG